MRLEWILRGNDLARASDLMDRVAEDWETLSDEEEFVQKGNLLIVTQSSWDDTDPYLSLEQDSLIFDGDRISFQTHCYPIILEIFDAQTWQECPSPEVFDTFLPHLAWWQVESDAEELATPYFTPGLAAA